MTQTYLNRWNVTRLLVVTFFLGGFSPTVLFSQQAKQSTKSAEYAALKMQPATFDHDEKWGKGGTFEGYTQQQEIIEKRSKNAKHFKNTDGTLTTQTGGNYHYKDEAGKWQDIDLKIEQGNTGLQDYFFKNVKNDVKSYFPKNAVTQGVLMKLEDGSDFIWWKNPQLKITSNGNLTKTHLASPVIGQASNEKLIYENIYNGISEEFVMLNGGIENNIILNSKTPEIASLSSGSRLEFSQFIPLNSGWTVLNSNGSKISSDTKTTDFSIQLGNANSRIYFGNIVVFDNNISKEEAMLVNMPADKLTQVQKQKLEQSVYTITYEIKFINGGIEIISALPSSWLNQSNRAFPVVIDPTVTVTPTGSTSSFYGPLSHWYGYQRHASLYLQSEIGISGTITDIEYNRITTGGNAGSRPTKVFMRTTANTALSSGVWNSADYTTGAQLCLDDNTDQGSTTGWKNLNLTAPFVYDQDNLMIMIYDAWGGGGSTKYYNQSSSATQRQAYSRADNTDPGDDASLTIENRLHEIRITYVPATECAGLPTSITATSNSANVCNDVSFTLSLTGIPLESGLTIQWQSSTDGGTTWNNLGTPQSTFSYTVTGGQTSATDYRAIITCVPTSDEVESSVVSVGMAPPIDCSCTPPTANCNLDDEIQNVTFAGINNNSSCTTGGYANYRSTVTPAEVLTGVNYPISVTTGDGGNESVAVWIDYNQDGIFDISEYTLVGVIAPGGTVTGNIMIPGSALSGTTVMRVRSFYVASGDPSLVYEETLNSACSTISTGYGETEDYAINITAGADCSGAPDAGIVSASLVEACLNESIVLTSNASNPYVGIVYQWQSSTDGTTWNDLGTPQTTITYTVASQSETTMYRLVVTCTITSDSEISATITVDQALPVNCYCINTIPANCTDGDVITNVTIESINNNSGCGNSSTGYSDYTTSVAPAQLEAGSTVPISVTVGPSGEGWLYESVGVWIDYNQNGILDSLEGEYTNLGTGLNQALTGNIIVPSTALTGPTRMRVVVMASMSMLNTYVCGPVLANNNFGEIEDYTVNILPETIVVVDSVVVTTQGGVPAEISVPMGTLQLEATVYPISANQDVTWSIIPVSGGATISTSGLVTAQSDGTVWAKAVSVEDNTKADSILITITNQGLGITDVNISDFAIYPNPTSDIVILKSGIEHSDLQLTISDLTGKVIFQDNLIGNELNAGYQIQLDNNSSGVYILQLTNNDINIQRQIVKK